MINYENILNNIKRYVSLTQADEDQFVAIVRTSKVKKKQFIVQPDLTCRHQTYVVQGAFRSYFVSEPLKFRPSNYTNYQISRAVVIP